MTYLDNAATTHICKEVLDEMIKSLDNFGNSESKFYSYGVRPVIYLNKRVVIVNGSGTTLDPFIIK